MSFLSGSAWQQPGIIGTSSGYGQQQQQKKTNSLPAVSVPTVPASSSVTSGLLSDWHCPSQMASERHDIQEVSKMSWMEDDVKSGSSRSDRFDAALNMEDQGLRLKGDKLTAAGAGGSLGSTGQSPSSPLSPYSLSSSPSISPGKDFANSSVESRQTTHPNFGHNNFNPTVMMSERNDSTDGFYIQGSQLVSQGQRALSKPNVDPTDKVNAFFTSTNSCAENKNDEKRSASSGDLLSNQKGGLITGLSGSQTKPSSAKHNFVTTVSDSSTALLTGSKNSGGDSPCGLPSNGAVKDDCVRGSDEDYKVDARRPPNSNSPESSGSSLSLKKDSNVDEKIVGSCTTLNKESKTSQQPQRTVVRRAMSDCSHLAVPMVMTGPYPTGIGGTPAMMPNVPNFTMMGTACPPRPPYSHVAVRRAFTVTDGTEAAAAMLMSSPLTPVVPSSPPPKRHHGSCETNVLLPVPPSVNSSQNGKLNTAGKYVLHAPTVSQVLK